MTDNVGERFNRLLGDLGIVRVVCVDDSYSARVGDIPNLVAWGMLKGNRQQMSNLLLEHQVNLDLNGETAQEELREILEQSPGLAVELEARISRGLILKNQEKTLGWCCNSPGKESISEALAKHGLAIDPSTNSGRDQLKKHVFGKSANPQLRNEITELWKAANDDHMSDAELHLFTDRCVLIRLDELLSGFPDFRTLTPEAWLRERDAILGDLEACPTLFIFDENLGQGIDSGTDMILQVGQYPNSQNAYFGLLSYTILTGAEHQKTRDLQAQDVAATAIPKRDLESEMGLEHLQLRLRAAVLWKESKDLRERCREVLQKAAESAYERVLSLTPLEFDEIVFRSSFKEGAHEMDTLVRVYSNAFMSHLRESLRSSAADLDDIDRLRSYRSDDLLAASAGSEAWRLQRDEYYEPGSYVNGCRMPTDAGDVFRISCLNEEDQDWVLVAPICNMVVRSSTGTRVEGVEEGMLCPILRKEPDPRQYKKTFPLEFFDESATAWVYFDLARSIDLRVLDLCAVDPDGLAKYLLGNAIPSHLSDGWSRWWIKGLEPFGRQLFGHTAEFDPWLDNSPPVPVGSIPFGSRAIIRLFTQPGQEVILPVRRTQRLAPILQGELVRAYGDYVSRPARPHSVAVTG